MSERLKVLISAYSCEPGRGSEPGLGWNTVREIARHHDAWVLTRPESQKRIEAELERCPQRGLNFVYHDLPLWRGWKPGESAWLIQFHYHFWQKAIHSVAQKLHREVGFDLAHHVTFARYWSPSPLALLEVPFLWGPVGGGESAPLAFWAGFGARGMLHEAARLLARRLSELAPGVRATARQSTLALATTFETAERLNRLGAPEVRVVSQVALAAEDIADLGGGDRPDSDNDSRRPRRFLAIGRLIHWKGFHLAVEAFARVAADPAMAGAEFELIGDGPERAALTRLVARLGLEGRVHLPGALPRVEVLRRLREADVLLHPSLHDSGGGVCAEAMAAGVPVICLDLGGPAVQVSEGSGIKVPARSPGQTLDDLAAAILRLARDPADARSLGEEAKRRVRDHHDWERKGRHMAGIYTQIHNQAASRR